MRTHLTESVWYDPDVKNYVMLDVTDAITPPTSLMIDDVELLPKDEYHCTLVPVGKLLEDDFARVLLGDISEYLSQNAVEFDGLTGEYHLCRKQEEVTLIASARIVGLDGLREVVRRHVPDYQPPFPHVTLLKSANSPYGIGVNSDADYDALCRPITLQVEGNSI